MKAYTNFSDGEMVVKVNDLIEKLNEILDFVDSNMELTAISEIEELRDELQKGLK